MPLLGIGKIEIVFAEMCSSEQILVRLYSQFTTHKNILCCEIVKDVEVEVNNLRVGFQNGNLSDELEHTSIYVLGTTNR
jgi:hypothetical protein